MNILFLNFNLPDASEGECSLCSKTAWCKPYGHDGKPICQSCAQNHPELVKAAVEEIARSVVGGSHSDQP